VNKVSKSKNNIKIELSNERNLTTLVVENCNFTALSKMIENHFSLHPYGNFYTDITGEHTLKYYKIGKLKISLGFSEWSPFIVFSESIKSNELIEKIYEWLQTVDIPLS